MGRFALAVLVLTVLVLPACGSGDVCPCTDEFGDCISCVDCPCIDEFGDCTFCAAARKQSTERGNSARSPLAPLHLPVAFAGLHASATPPAPAPRRLTTQGRAD